MQIAIVLLHPPGSNPAILMEWQDDEDDLMDHIDRSMRALACGPWHAGPGMGALACGPWHAGLFCVTYLSAYD